MIAIKTADLTQNFKQIADMVVNGEQVLISRPKNENLVVITQKEYNALDKMRRNAEYLAKLDRGTDAIKNNELINVSFEDLKAMEN